MDLKHVPELRDAGAFCVNCDIGIPLDVAGLGDVVELGGAGTHWVPDFAYDGPKKGVKNCHEYEKRGKALVQCPNCDGAGCDQCDRGVVVSDGSQVEVKAAEPRGGERIERAPKKSKFEKTMARAASQNFWAMREATNPNGGNQ